MSEFRNFNMDDMDDVSEAVRIGIIWDAPGWAIEKAIKAINAGTIPVPAYVPERYAAYITVDEAPVPPPVEPAYTGGRDINLPTPAEGPVEDEEALPPLGGEALA